MTGKIAVPREVRKEIQDWFGGLPYQGPDEVQWQWYTEACRRYFLAGRNVKALESMLPRLARIIDHDTEGFMRARIRHKEVHEARETLQRVEGLRQLLRWAFPQSRKRGTANRKAASPDVLIDRR